MNSLKIIYLSIVLFVAQIFFVAVYSDKIHALSVYFIEKHMSSLVLPGQSFSIDAAYNALESNGYNGFKIFWFGGSTAHNYFDGQSELFSQDGQHFHVYNLSFATQSMYDILRLVDNIQGPGVVVIGVHPGKLFSHNQQQVIKGYYKTGQGYLVFIPSVVCKAFYYSQDWGRVSPSYTKLFILNPELGVVKQVLDSSFRYLNKRFVSFARNEISVSSTQKDNAERFSKLPGLSYEKRLNKFSRYRKSLLTKKDKKAQLNLLIINEICKLAASKGLEVVLFEHPVSLMYKEEMAAIVTRYGEYIKHFKQDNPSVAINKFDWENYEGDDYLFTDGMHLSRAGKKVFPSMLKLFFNNMYSMRDDSDR